MVDREHLRAVRLPRVHELATSEDSAQVKDCVAVPGKDLELLFVGLEVTYLEWDLVHSVLPEYLIEAEELLVPCQRAARQLQLIDHRDLRAAGEEPVDHVRPDEACAS